MNNEKTFKQKSKLNVILKKIFLIPEVGILIPLIILIVIFSSINPVFISPLNVANILRTMSYYGIVACGLTFLMISGEIDLSVGSVAGLGSVVTGLLLKYVGLNFLLSIFIGIIAGAFIGLLNGILSVKFKIPSLIATLGMMYLGRGLIYVITGGNQIYPLGEPFKSFGAALPLGIGWVFVFFLIVFFMSDQTLRMTSYGRSIYAIGGNIEAARIAGINTAMRKISAFIISGALAALAGVLITARIATVTPIIGQDWALTVIAGVVIGGTSIIGGIGSIVGTTIGILIMGVVSTGLVMIGINPLWQTVIIGVIMLLAVGIDVLRRSRIK